MRMLFGTTLLGAALLANGCTSHRYTTTLPPGSDPALTHGTARFAIVQMTSKRMGNDPDAAIVPKVDRQLIQVVQRAAERRYPGLFASDWTAIPLVVDMQSRARGVGSWGPGGFFVPVIIPCALGVLPVPMGYRCQFNIRVNDLGKSIEAFGKEVTFERADLEWSSLWTPLGLIPMIGRSDISRFSKPSDPYLFTYDCLAEAVKRLVVQSDPAAASAEARRRQLRLQMAPFGGGTYWVWEGVDEASGKLVVNVFSGRPDFFTNNNPVESVVVGERSGASYVIEPTFLRCAPLFTEVTVEAREGAWVPVVRLQAPPRLEPFVETPDVKTATTDYLKWQVAALVEIQNRYWAQIAQGKTADDWGRLAAAVQKALLDCASASELAKDQAQMMVEKGEGDAAVPRALALAYKEKIAVLTPILKAIKSRVP